MTTCGAASARASMCAAEACLHTIFEAQVAAAPDRLAVTDGRESLSYRELNDRANGLAHVLRARGVHAERLVGLLLDRSVDLVVGVLGILKAGGAYLPLDMDAPRERLAFMLRDAAACLVVTNSNLIDSLPGDVAVLAYDPADPTFAAQPASNPQTDTRPDQLAYVIYTSGSTGQPKGVAIEHRSVVSLMQSTQMLFGFQSDDVWTLFHSIAFDFSVWEIWGALFHGGCLVVVPRDTARSPDEFYTLLLRHQVTVLNQTPSAFGALIGPATNRGNETRLSSLRYVIFGGEALDPRMLRRWVASHGDTRPKLVNMYGITETTVHVTHRHITAADVDAGGSPIGGPIPGVQLYLLDAALAPVPPGETGEIFVGGSGLARCYLNRPELTAERFIANPFSPDAGARLYRSGDLGRALPEGGIAFLGRADAQVKIRGFRIEPGEIEATLAAIDGVAQAAVVARRDDGDARLIAYVVPRPGGGIDGRELRRHLRTRLPEYMVPAAFVVLPALPLTTNGKLDRAALPAPGRNSAGGSACPPANALEAELAAIWRDLLGLDSVGRHDNFFDVGGHSLLAARLAALIQARHRVRLRPSQIFAAPTLAGIAGLVRDAAPLPPSLPQPAINVASTPMSFAQRGVWFQEALTPGISLFLLPQAWRLHGKLDRAALCHALDNMVARHAPLRTRFGLADGSPVQCIEPPIPIVLHQQDLAHLPAAERKAEALRLARAEADRPFDLAHDLPLRVRLLRLDAEDHVLLVTMHHIVSDAWSLRLFNQELAVLYQAARCGAPASLPPLPLDYASHARRERQALTPARTAELQAWWRRALSGLEPLELPRDRARPPVPDHAAGRIGFHLEAPLVAQLEHLARRSEATLQMVLLAGFQVLLSRTSGQQRFAVATATAGRNEADLEMLIGLFVNTLLIPADFSGNPSFCDVVRRVAAASVGAYDHQDLPFEQVVALLRPGRGSARNSLAQAIFQLVLLDDDALALDGLDVTPLPVASERVRFELELDMRRDGPALRGTLTYSAELYDAVSMQRLTAQYATLLRAVAAEPDAPLSRVEALDAAERRTLLEEWSGIAATTRDYGSVADGFAAQAALTPAAPAVVFGSERIEYRDLERASARLAHRLRRQGVRRGDRVGLFGRRCVATVIATLGIVRAGAAYVPLDPGHPPDRLRFMMQDAACAALVACADPPAELLTAVPHVLYLDDDDPPVDGAMVALAGGDSAYAMYTSGSTGVPKGVLVPHRAIVRLVRDTNYIRIDASDRIGFASNTGFDAATFEIWGALLNGACLVGLDQATLLSPSALAAAIRTDGITIVFLTTALFHEVADAAPDSFAALGCLLVGGERLDPRRVRAVLASRPPKRLLHVYGPTENTTFSTWLEITPQNAAGDSIPIGRPVAGSTCYVLDRHGALLPPGAIGEICVGGAGVALGYLDGTGLRHDRFPDNPFAPGTLLYRTGDRGRWLPDGTLQFLGRVDRQVKLRGHRIEPGEIEAALDALAGVRQSAVILAQNGEVDRLVAYVVPNQGASIDAAALRRALQRTLPDYMVPHAIIPLERLPLSPNGKLDLPALPPPGGAGRQTSRSGSSPPASPTETALARIWSEVLDVAEPSAEDNFFDLGGTSLLAMRMLARMEAVFGRHPGLPAFHRHPTLAGLAGAQDAAAEPGTADTVLEIRAGGTRPPLYFPPGVMGESAVYPDLLGALEPGRPVRALLPGPPDGPLPASIEALAAQYCRTLCQLQPDGPICLAGYSFAGIVAYEMARQLAETGRETRFLGIIDTGPDSVGPRTAAALLRDGLHLLRNLPRWVRDEIGRGPAVAHWLALARSARTLLRRLAEGAMRRGPRHEAADLFDTSDWSPALRAQVANNLRILSAYRYPPYNGRLVLFRAVTRPLLHSHLPDLGWRGCVEGGVTVVDLPGNHQTVTRPPIVRQLAAEFCAALDRAEG
ncbi:MAG: amino acid adenylation domain-containing protein [Proteobacteria bacterium]|nr:amino acid adenylation domain-containing protein [Pseudomonadota bacterium]